MEAGKRVIIKHAIGCDNGEIEGMVQPPPIIFYHQWKCSFPQSIRQWWSQSVVQVVSHAWIQSKYWNMEIERKIRFLFQTIQKKRHPQL